MVAASGSAGLTRRQAVDQVRRRIAPLDARLLLQHCLGISHVEFLTRPDEPLAAADSEAFMALVYGVKRGDVGETARAGMRRLARGLADAGAQAVIAGCTEVPLLLRAEDAASPLTDSAEVLAQACVKACLSFRP